MRVLHFIMAVCCLKVAQTSNQFKHNERFLVFNCSVKCTRAGIQFMQSLSTRHTHELNEENSSMTNLGICSHSLTANIIFPKMRFQNNKSAFRALRSLSWRHLHVWHRIPPRAVKWVFVIQIFTEGNHYLWVGVSQPFLIFRWPYSVVANMYIGLECLYRI